MRPKRGRNFGRNSGRNQWKSHNNHHRSSQNREPREYRHSDQLTEKDVGITEYLSPLDGFSGIIKARYSDFQLNEIDLEGNIAKLTNMDIPKDFSLKMVKYNYNDIMESPNENISQEMWESIKKLVDNNDGEPIILNAENIDKEARSKIHTCVKSHFGRKVILSTVDLDGKKVMKFEKFTKDIVVDTRSQWPADKGEYVYFIVYKEKMDTLEAVFKISSAIGIGSSQFHHAGNKDRRSITSQWFSVKKLDPWKLIVKTNKLPNIRIGNITFKDVPLRLGQLKGNKFRIALRNVTATDEVINEGLNYLKEHHFINYYGLQRFGNDKEVPTYQVGLSLLQGKWKEAIDLILKPKQSDDPHSNQSDIVEAKKIYSETGIAKDAYEALNRNRGKSVEGKLLEGLKKNNENDYVTALERVPRSMRLLYLHAFQSLIWNRMVSKRLQLFGRKPVVGDFVLMNDVEGIPEQEDIETNESEEANSSKKDDAEIKPKMQVKCLCEEDLDKYSIFDIVLPLPGYDVIYPENMKIYYKESVEEHGLNLEMTKQRVKTYTLSGSYRKIFGKVEDLTWKIVKYNNPTDNLILSDLQQLKGETELQIDENGQYKALIMEFSLSSCSYATMVLREIMKIDTSSNVHSKLNNYQKVNLEEGKVEEEEESISETSLLTDSAKFESFKNSIFNTSGEKRTASESEEPSKKQKLDDVTEDKTD